MLFSKLSLFVHCLCLNRALADQHNTRPNDKLTSTGESSSGSSLNPLTYTLKRLGPNSLSARGAGLARLDARSNDDVGSGSATSELIPITSTSGESLSNLVLVADVIDGAASFDAKNAATSSVDTAGSDITYYIDVQLGSTKQNFSIVVDTGSYYTWVYGTNTTTSSEAVSSSTSSSTASASSSSASSSSSSKDAAAHNTFNTTSSTSLEVLPYTFSVLYSSGAVSGSVVNDIMSFSGFETRMDFGVATEAGSTFSSFPIDGIIGLSAKDISSDFPGIMTTLKNQSLIDKSVFGINLGSSSDTSDEGSITFGGVDESKYTGNISYSDVVAVGGSVLWKIPVDGANMGKYAVNFDGDRTAVVDTGTTLLVLPPDDALKLHSYIKGAETDGSNFAVPCSTNISLEIRIGDTNWTIAAEDYVGSPITSGSSTCISNIQGLSSQGNTTWILGDVFLKNIYSIFDLDNQRVGFAQKVISSTQETAADSIVYSSLSIPADTLTMSSATISESAFNNLYTAVYNGTNSTATSLEAIHTSTSMSVITSSSAVPTSTTTSSSTSSSKQTASASTSSSSSSATSKSAASASKSFTKPIAIMGYVTPLLLAFTL